MSYFKTILRPYPSYKRVNYPFPFKINEMIWLFIYFEIFCKNVFIIHFLFKMANKKDICIGISIGMTYSAVGILEN